MDVTELNVEVARLRERDKSHENKGDGHDEQIRSLWAAIKEQGDRLRAVEVRMAVIATAASCGGGIVGTVVGSFAQNWFK